MGGVWRGHRHGHRGPWLISTADPRSSEATGHFLFREASSFLACPSCALLPVFACVGALGFLFWETLPQPRAAAFRAGGGCWGLATSREQSALSCSAAHQLQRPVSDVMPGRTLGVFLIACPVLLNANDCLREDFQQLQNNDQDHRSRKKSVEADPCPPPGLSHRLLWAPA